MSRDVIKELADKTAKTISIMKEELNTVRAGRANAALLDKVTVDYYGSPTPLKNISNISVPDPRTLMISPFDPKSIAEIEKAINIANLGITPSNDGKCIRLVIPQLTEERRKELCKQVKKIAEQNAELAVQRPRDGIVKFKADGAGLRGDEIVHAHGQQGEERAECINRHVGIGVGKCCFACAEPLKKRSFQQ